MPEQSGSVLSRLFGVIRKAAAMVLAGFFVLLITDLLSIFIFGPAGVFLLYLFFKGGDGWLAIAGILSLLVAIEPLLPSRQPELIPRSTMTEQSDGGIKHV
jgi:hypothetical protein